MLSMMAVTNKDYCMVNTLIATMPDGEEYVFDRDMTEYSINNGVLVMNWYGIYLWDGEEPSLTTSTHIKSFCGLTKREFMAL